MSSNSFPGIEICLNNAVVLVNEYGHRTVQLGMDFFESAARARCSTMISECGTFVVTDGGHTSDVFMEDQADEIRYYSGDVKICQLLFIHVKNLTSEEATPIVSIPVDSSTQFGEWQWCCRYFPCDGMFKCTAMMT